MNRKIKWMRYSACLVALMIAIITGCGTIVLPEEGTSPPLSEGGTSPPLSEGGTSPPLSEEGMLGPHFIREYKTTIAK